MTYFFVAMSHRRYVILYKQYHEKITGGSFAEFVRQYFPKTFEKSSNIEWKQFFKYGDPRQISRLAKLAMQEIGCTMFQIPTRSLDLNLIENVVTC